TNVEGGDPDPSYLAFQSLGRHLGTPVDAPVVPIAAEKLADYTGVYQLEGGAYRHLYVENGRLMSRRSGGTAFALQAIGPDQFQYAGSLSRVRFLRGADGRVNAMEFDTRRTPKTVHPRTADAPPAEAPEF